VSVHRQYFPFFRPGDVIPTFHPVITTATHAPPHWDLLLAEPKPAPARRWFNASKAAQTERYLVLKLHPLGSTFQVAYVIPGAEPCALAWYELVQSLATLHRQIYKRSFHASA